MSTTSCGTKKCESRRFVGIARTDEANSNAIGWLTRHIDRFVPDDVFATPRKSKPLLELILLVAYRLRASPVAHGEETDVIVDSIVRLADKPDLPCPIRNNNQLVVQAGLCSVLSLGGQRNDDLEHAVQRAIDTGLLDQCERLPHHVMIERTMLDWGGFSHSLPSLAELTHASMLARHPSALYQSERSAYEITHDIMFGCSLGERTLTPTEPQMCAEDMQTLLRDLLARFEIEGNWDLVGELLLCWDCLGLLQDGAYHRGWNALLHAQDSDGSVPARWPTDDSEEHEATSRIEDDRFNTRYHTTLVLCLAATARSRRDEFQRGPVERTCSGSLPSASHYVRSAEWLASLLRGRSVAPTPQVAMGTLVGLVLLTALDSNVQQVSEQVTPEIVAHLHDCVQFSEAPATLTLIAFGILRNRGHEFPALSHFVSCMNTVLTDASPDAATALAWCEKRMVLAQLGLSPTPALPSWDEIGEFLESDTVNPRQLCEIVGASSGYGTLSPRELSKEQRCDADRLESMAVDIVRRRDLVSGCSLLRGLHLVRPLSDDRIKTLSRYLNAQQNHCGAYGFGNYALRAGAAAIGADGTDVEASVQLPTSLAVWWTLAELQTDFRLFTSLRLHNSSIPPTTSSRP